MLHIWRRGKMKAEKWEVIVLILVVLAALTVLVAEIGGVFRVEGRPARNSAAVTQIPVAQSADASEVSGCGCPASDDGGPAEAPALPNERQPAPQREAERGDTK
jgi:hypothetical protein